MSLSLNGAIASSVRVLTPWAGPWTADVVVPVAPGAPTPTGAAVLVLGDSGSLVGKIDANASGVAAGKAAVRIVAGGGGWEKIVPPKPYKNDGGLISTVVLSTTAAEVGETVLEALPSRLGDSYTRAAGPASRVLAGLAWYVDARGITIVGPRPTVPASTDVRILDYDPRTAVAELATTTELVVPGTVLTDERFGVLKVRDVEQTFSTAGARARAWCIPAATVPSTEGLPGSRMLATLAAIAREAVGVAHLPAYRYRVVRQGLDLRATLQIVDPTDPVPSLQLVTIVPGLAGATMKLAPGAIVLVSFVGGDPTKAVVRGFEGGPDPLEVALTALLLKLNGGTMGVARVGDAVVAGPFGGAITTGSLTVRCG